MSVTNLLAQSIGEGAWRLSWDATGATSWVYVDGVLWAQTSANQILLSVSAGEAPVIEVLDDPADTPAAGYPGCVILAWWAVAGASGYRVEQLIGATWTAQRWIEEDGRGYYLWRSAGLADGATHQFRVIAEGVNDGVALSFSVPVVRRPDPPAASWSYADGKVTIA